MTGEPSTSLVLVWLTSCSEIRVWTLEGDAVYTLSGHTSFVYSLAVLPNGDIVSGGEDRTVRVWRGAFLLTLDMDKTMAHLCALRRRRVRTGHHPPRDLGLDGVEYAERRHRVRLQRRQSARLQCV